MESELTGLLEELVAIPSVNPGFGGDGEGRLGAFVADWLTRRGMVVEVQEVFPGRNNVIARCPGGGTGPAWLLDAHLDTVGVEGWAKGNPFKPWREGNRLYGRGSCDTKASLAVFMSVAAWFARNRSELAAPLVFAGTVDEEIGQTGASALAGLGQEFLGAIVGEPTRLEIEHAHKGVLRFAVTTRGLAAHSSRPERGENAIMRMGRVLERLSVYERELKDSPGDFSLGKPTVSVGIIRGGKGVNIVPDVCRIEVDRRMIPGETPEAILRRIEDLLEGCPSAEVEGSSIMSRFGLSTPTSHPICRELDAALRRAGETPRFLSSPGMTNAGIYAKAGLPAVVFGPGDIRMAHTVDEWVDTGYLPRAFEVLRQCLSHRHSPL